MVVSTKYFGDIELNEDKILNFEHGILGFEDNTRFTLLYNDTDNEKASISWLQSIDKPSVALPVIHPSLVIDEYNPTIEDELLKELGELTDDNIVILLALTVPSDLTKMTANLKAPFIINADTKKGCQVIADNSEYMIKYPIYELFSNKKL